jgi:hypothetical protein
MRHQILNFISISSMANTGIFLDEACEDDESLLTPVYLQGIV